MFKRTLIISLLLVTIALSANPTLSIQTQLNQNSYNVGDTLVLGITVVIPVEYHLYSNPLGPGIGKPLKLSTAPLRGIRWLSAKADSSEKYITEGFEDEWTWSWQDEVNFFITGVVTDSSEGTIDGQVELDGLICKTACVPVSNVVKFSVNLTEKELDEVSFENNSYLFVQFKKATEFPVDITNSVSQAQSAAVSPFAKSTGFEIQQTIFEAEDSQPTEWDYSPQESKRNFSIGLGLLFAFIAGIILNFMPCVLPVLGIKIISFSKGRTGSKSEAIVHSLAFAAGMIVVFFLLGTLAAFAGMSWGEQFQNPVFIVVLVSLMFVFGLGMFDLFIILVPSKISAMDMKHDTTGLWGNFLKGAFATVLATPCSGPFLGATLAWAVTQPKLTIYLIFLTLGAGMASPYILLASSTRLSKIIPKPGAWMEDFKHILGFFLFGFAVYLMVGLPRDWVLPTVGILVAVGASVMLYTRVAPFGSSLVKKLLGLIFSILIIFAGYHLSFTVLYSMTSEAAGINAEKDGTVKWHNFDAAELQAAHARGQNVIIDFTANWCMNCQFNKISIYHTEEMEELIAEKEIYTIKADLTNDNPTAESLMKMLGSQSVPFFAIFPAENWKEPIIMRDILKKKTVFDELKRLK
jgi:thiol:disulfide interchange protein